MKRQTFNEINITPLTDIFLVLLILMMVIAPILDQQGLSLAVPQYVEQNQVNKDSKILTVTVTADNRYLINNSEISQGELLTALKEKISANPDGMLIQADGNSSHEYVVKLMDNARNAGVTSISIVEL
ncbi:MAG: biopolymer transporter ExbD [Candidatus Gastranaerophilales bacterium]|nr:biopolymer transporter ExbD [Candidatus Gastranaerophilales bacterium]